MLLTFDTEAGANAEADAIMANAQAAENFMVFCPVRVGCWRNKVLYKAR